MIASLAMYDFGAAMAANDRLWRLIREGLLARGLPAPDVLTRGEAAYWPAWTAPDLILSQTCGYPFRARLHDKVALVGTPDNGLPDCPAGHYFSVFVARADDPRQTLAAFDGADFAWNEDLSQSGWAAPQNHAIRAGVRLVPAFCSGGHRNSARAVAEGKADLAAIDAVTWAIMGDLEPQLVARLRPVARTEPTPALPFITARDRDPAVVREALVEAIAGLAAEDRALLRLRGVVELPTAAYLAIASPPSPQAMGAPGCGVPA